MDEQFFAPPPSAPIQNPPPSPSTMEWIFQNEQGLRAGWRLLIYAVLVVVLGFGVGIAAGPFLRHLGGRTSPWPVLAQEVVGFSVVFGAALLMSLIEKRGAGDYGLPGAGALGKL